MPGIKREGPSKLKRRMKALMRGGNTCYYCGKPVVRNKKGDTINYPNTATIEHLFSIRDIRRALVGFIENTVLACFSCNNSAGAKESARFWDSFDYVYKSVFLFDTANKKIILDSSLFNQIKMEQQKEVALELPALNSDQISKQFAGIADRSRRGVLALSKVQTITNDDEDRIANDLMVKVNATIDGGKDANGNAIPGIKSIRMETTRQLDGIKAMLMEPEKLLLAEAARVNELRNSYARAKEKRIREQQEAIEAEKKKNDEIARIKAAIRSNIVEGVVAAINLVNASIRTYFDAITLESYEAAVAKFNMKPKLKEEVYLSFFTSVRPLAIISNEMFSAIVAEMKLENPYEKINASYVEGAESTLKMWIDDLPKKKADLERMKELQATNAIEAQKEQERQEKEREAKKKEQEAKLQLEADQRKAEIERQENEEKLQADFNAQVGLQSGETLTGVRKQRVAIIDCKPEDIVITLGKILLACYGNPKFPGHLKRDKKGVILGNDENDVPQYADWAQDLLNFVAKEHDGQIPGVSFKEVVAVVNKKRTPAK
jgi:hypothetical protein